MMEFVNIHTHKPESGNIYILNAQNNSESPDAEYSSYGIHPWNIGQIDVEAEIEALKKYCIENKLLAVGEIGLDRAIQTTFDIQKQVFSKQLSIASKYNLPVIIHCVKAWSDILSIKKNEKNSSILIFHGYSGNLQTAKQLMNAGCYLSFGAKLFDNKKIQETFKQIPLNHIFLETDNSDTKIEDIYQKAAELFDICIDELKSKIHQNFIKVFGERCTKNG